MAVAVPRSFFSSRFFIGLLLLALVVATLGGSIFRYLTASVQTTTAQTQPVAIATTFVPATSPFTISLLTSPEALLSLEAVNAAAPQPTNPSDTQPSDKLTLDIAQLKQRWLASTGLDYERDLRPWLGNEMTFAITDADIDLNETNGAQPGYLLATAIAPQKQREAREFLQRLWQQRSLAGRPPNSVQINGVRVLHSDLDSLTAASAVVGDRFVVFANDVRVLRRSIRAAQSAMNLAQDRVYRDTVEQLPHERIGLAYFSDTFLSANRSSVRKRAAMSIALAPGGVMLKLRPATTGVGETSAIASDVTTRGSVAAMRGLPADSSWAIASTDLAQLLSSEHALSEHSAEPTAMESTAAERIRQALPQTRPKFLPLGEPYNTLAQSRSAQSRSAQSNPLTPADWAWANGDYALGQVGDGWVLVVERDAEAIKTLDQAAQLKGYSSVPVALDIAGAESEAGEEPEATDSGSEVVAWTRFKAKQRYRSAESSLETDVLGLHLQRGDYEIFADSLRAMQQAIATLGRSPSNRSPSNSSLRDFPTFAQAIAALPSPNSGYLYADKTATADILSHNFPIAQRILQSIQPLFSHVRSVSATQSVENPSEETGAKHTETVSVFVQMNR